MAIATSPIKQLLLNLQQEFTDATNHTDLQLALKQSSNEAFAFIDAAGFHVPAESSPAVVIVPGEAQNSQEDHRDETRLISIFVWAQSPADEHGADALLGTSGDQDALFDLCEEIEKVLLRPGAPYRQAPYISDPYVSGGIPECVAVRKVGESAPQSVDVLDPDTDALTGDSGWVVELRFAYDFVKGEVTR